KTKIPIDCFYDTNVLPHPKQVIIAAIERQIVQEPSDARLEWLRAASTFLWNFLDGVDAAPVPLMAVDLDRLLRDAAPNLVVQQIVTQFCAIEDERNEPLKDQQIGARITAAIDMRLLAHAGHQSTIVASSAPRPGHAGGNTRTARNGSCGRASLA